MTLPIMAMVCISLHNYDVFACIQRLNAAEARYSCSQEPLWRPFSESFSYPRIPLNGTANQNPDGNPYRNPCSNPCRSPHGSLQKQLPARTWSQSSRVIKCFLALEAFESSSWDETVNPKPYKPQTPNPKA